jgi:serine/threonine protein kinase
MTDPTMSPTPPVVPGYLLAELIGRGASSTVWSGRSETSGEPVAIKVTSPTAHRTDLLDIAAREQAILERVSSEHVVRLHEALPLEDGSVALVLDLADGGSLQDLVSIRGGLDVGEVVTIFTPIATTLGELHAGGVVHSDLSPGNILFTHTGKPMLSDYDGARLVGEQHPHTVSGTRGFVAPEVYRGALPTEASDIWSLAALAWYAVTGGSTPPVEDVEEVGRATLGPQLAPVVLPMLAADPAARPSAAHVAMAIYRASPPAPVLLAGRNPDPASAMTHRIRQEAALEPSSSSRVPARSATSVGTSVSSARPGAGGTRRRRRSMDPRPPLSVGLRLAIVLGAALVFTAGLLFLLARTNARTGPPPSAVTATSATGKPTTATPRSPVAQLQADPASVVQGLADARAAALMSGDPARLLMAQVQDSSAYATDVTTLNTMRSQGQRYADLVFHVRSAEIVRVDAKSAQVLAVIDRAVYTVVGPGTARQQLPAQEGRAYQYVLSLGPQGWRIIDILES